MRILRKKAFVSLDSEVPKGYKKVIACPKKYKCPYCNGRTYKIIPK